MSQWIQTYTGRKVFPLDIRKEDVDIVDIAHALSLKCRFGGHCNEFYSVADHSLRVMEITPEPYKFHALMHDAAEAYLCDVPSPVKSAYYLRRVGVAEHMQRLIAYEDSMTRLIIEHLIALTGGHVQCEYDEAMMSVGLSDLKMLMTEAEYNLSEKPEPWAVKVDPLPREKWAPPLSPYEAERRFMNAYYILTKGPQ